ncbi:MAG TPA: hypothetical protein VK050_10960 [Flavobacteriaceae bacterium]|nr:hypothetical protein [Flavobacteriaceae bacterium]
MRAILKNSITSRQKKIKAVALQRLLTINKRLYHSTDLNNRDYVINIYHENVK